MSKKALGIDIGGTKIYSAIIDENGNFLSEISRNSTPKTLNGIVETLKKIIKENEDKIDVVAFSTAGAV